MGIPAKKGIVLRLDGKVLQLSPEPPSLSRVRATLDALPSDQLYTTPEVLRLCHISLSLLDRHAADLLGYHAMVHGRKRYWGSRAAIQELLRQARPTE